MSGFHKYRIGAAALAACALSITAPAHAAVEISAKPTSNMTCTGGVCSPKAKNAVLNTTDLANMLATSDVKVVTGSGAVTITVSSSFSWTSSSRLTLDAYYTVSFRAPVEVAGQGAVTIITNDGGSGGDLIFFPGGSLDFWDLGSSLIINRNGFALVGDRATMINDIAANHAGSYALARSLNRKATRESSLIGKFTGTFEGLGHAISGLTLKSNKEFTSIALFRQSSGTIRDLNIAIAVVQSGRSSIVAGLVARNSGALINDNVSATVNASNPDAAGLLVGLNDGLIERCSSDGTISGTTEYPDTPDIGGIAGYNATLIDNSNSAASVGGYRAGGIAGYNGGTISNSHFTGMVGDDSTGEGGGLVGYNGRLITTSFATGNVTAHNGFAGGLVGDNEGGTIDQSFATGAASGGHTVGGLAGVNSGIIQNSYALGNSNTDQGMVGGLVGANEKTITDAYSTGMPSATQTDGSYVGGFVGDDTYGSVTSGYWDLDTSGIINPAQGAGNIANDPGITGLTDAQLKSALPAGFDPAIWERKKKINNGYPYLLANPPPQ